MEPVKEAFSKVKQDIEFLKEEFASLRKDLIETRESLIDICEIIKENSKKDEKKEERSTSTDRQIIKTNDSKTTTDNVLEEPLNDQNLGISTGNGGVPTDRQTDRQTDQQTHNSSYNQENMFKESSNDSIDNAIQMLESLDNLKKEIRLKFKRLTEKEILVFSTLYQCSDEKGYTDYRELSEKLKLTESSIRDYVGRLIKKGIPVDKIKVNNKMIHLSISPNLKKVATLSTILKLRSI